MEMTGLMGSFYRVSVFISRLAYINLLWIFFSLVGLVVIGVMPATVAMFTVMRKWLDTEDVPIFKTFLQTYKSEFIKSNLYGLFFIFVGYILYVNFILAADQVIWMMVVRYCLLVVSILFITTLLLFFPIYVRLELQGTQYIKTALLLGVAYPQYTCMIVIGIVGIQYMMMTLPGLTLFFAASLVSYFITRVVNIIFKVVERKKEHMLNEATEITSM
ncbi:YesL family protein [Bacillus suaedae]|uniref:YesL family protein n=1 Tax=Halalkalibacter suaedae TaxID=2822140 RepID=A0A940X0K0_9BACI|nr:YesL family protein [Bacillus suaedae]MBP3952866.1 YesL family protein [Bacillus suaedae]